MKTSKEGVALIKKYEGCRLKAYLCPSKVATIGFGNTYYEDKSKVKLGDVITQERAEQLLMNLLPKYEAIVNKNITRELKQNEYDALVSFCFNCGSSTTLFSMVNKNDSNISKWWMEHYITGGGKVLPGLVKRRKEEAELYDK